MSNLREDFDELRIDYCENVWKIRDVVACMYLLCCIFTCCENATFSYIIYIYYIVYFHEHIKPISWLDFELFKFNKSPPLVIIIFKKPLGLYDGHYCNPKSTSPSLSILKYRIYLCTIGHINRKKYIKTKARHLQRSDTLIFTLLGFERLY